MLHTTIESIPGFSVAGIASGVKKHGKRDLALVVSDRPCAAAGVFTTNLVKAAPVHFDQAQLARNPGGIRAVVTNAGVANACTGEQGDRDAAAMAAHTAAALGCDPQPCDPQGVLVLSTGVIGAPLPMDKIAAGITCAAGELAPDGWDDAAAAIMTTDTRPKLARVTVETADGTYSVAGIAKGSGMIAPHMATMLATLVTDAALDAPTLQAALAQANRTSFNRIVVDGDMSTNDTVLLLANGASGVQVSDGAALAQFTAALEQVCVALAKAIVQDGEGVTRFITLTVTGAADEADALKVATTIATSPLVKTAFYGGDANWGRILAAAGRADVPLDPNKLVLWFAPGETPLTSASNGSGNGLKLVSGGAPTAYAEADAAAIMAEKSVAVRLDLGMGQAEAIVWTCDLSHDYVSINGHYRS
ncbi:MAG: bifunctional glutamate N-acetyltransferase/amino-acid acetyltransferase ArgJ [Anaerolineae bacterium]|nr:bifunctional glutamate N-acetyltransferase/amino-acid acetyltransferase ArgJ [Anaerolineae bacterium]